MNFTVDRATWYRGKRTGSQLLRSDGLQCCIGFVCQQSGISASRIRNIKAITERISTNRLPDWMQVVGLSSSTKNPDLYACYEINDDTELEDDVRENRLQEIFARHGDTITFV